ncbi:hypothetical protein CEP54_003431 [Fusarium duplospermum]|uniref:Uncharacterized protein n=1 Tax=Fusarium duplospermum TaxID=1325734 RepID=A0A428QNP8_9HYPO|nr:hypothetical protein CEP54_003431 [Fusarium duplospermum]
MDVQVADQVPDLQRFQAPGGAQSLGQRQDTWISRIQLFEINPTPELTMPGSGRHPELSLPVSDKAMLPQALSPVASRLVIEPYARDIRD